ncbi:MAG: radical SAM protein [Caldilineaceae bacterium]|nr:radical SAM protein [Caldilineaceae bacterium]
MAQTFHWQQTNTPLHISLAGGTLTLSFDGKVNLSFDGEGRLVGAFLEQITYRRALDNRILAKWIDAERAGRRQRRFLDEEERHSLLDRCYEMAADVAAGLTTGQLIPPANRPALDLIDEWLARVAGWDWPKLEAERTRFLDVYKPVPILPPDQYLSTVVQATEGCSYNRCTFCTFYQDRPFRIKTLPQLQNHLTAIEQFLGRGLTLRRGIFLADANAVIVAQRTLLPMLDAIAQKFAILPPDLPAEDRRRWQAGHPIHADGIYAFISAPDALHKTSADFADLRDRHLRRVYVGLESGHDPLRHFLAKPGRAADVLRAVETIKAGGVGVGLIAMIGVGGEIYREAHRRDTVALIERMPLDHNDILYLSPFVADAASPYAQDIESAEIEPMGEDAIEEEIGRFRSALKAWTQPRGVRFSTYDIREFIY